MGFLSGLGRLIAGKPVFVAGENVDKPSVDMQQQAVDMPPVDDLKDASGHKIAPQITVSHVKSHLSGSSMTVTAWVTNNSQYSVRLDTCTMLSRESRLYRDLSPGQGHEMQFYRGSVVTNDHDYKVRLTFRITENTDEFEMNYVAKFDRNSDGTFIIDQLHQNGSVRDI